MSPRLLLLWFLSMLMAGLALTGAATSPPSASSPPERQRPNPTWTAKLEPGLLQAAKAGPIEFILFLEQQADLSQTARLKTRPEKGAYVYRALSNLAARTQPPLLKILTRLEVEHRPYWVANMIWVKGDLNVIQMMARQPTVARIYANPRVRLAEPRPGDSPGGALASVNGVEWNIGHVNAPEVWSRGYTGQAVIIGGQDTGYQWNHPALLDQYRGWDGQTADHNYHWHDAIHSGGSAGCPADSPVPCDDHNHGTHTMGTMVGDDGGPNQIGMAPGAQWIGCRNMDGGFGTPVTYAECYEWFIAPTDLNGQNPDPGRAPHVINNSWGCPPFEGCTEPEVLLAVVQNVRAAGIVTVHSAGNSGSGCGSVEDPAAIYAESFTVGAATSADQIASFSSRGPVTVDGSNRLKPDISAPGVNIRSSIRGDGYRSWQGTSMAGPHVAGLVALLISARPALAGQVNRLESLIEQSAVPRTTGQNCGDVPGSQRPNNTYGWGRIDALAALSATLTTPGVELAAGQTGLARPGQTITYSHLLTNSGALTDAFDLTLSSSLGWTVAAAPPVITLPAAHTASFRLRVSPPASAAGGLIELTRLTATSRYSPALHAVLTDATQVAYPYYLPVLLKTE